MNVEQMVAAASRLSRKARYTVDISTPINSVKDQRHQSIMLNCHTASFPGTTLGVNEQTYFGLAFTYPVDWKYTALDLDFYLDVDFSEKKYFESWLASIYNINTGRYGFKDDYVRDVTITSLDVQNKPRYRVRLTEAYPVNIGQVSVGYDAKNAFATLSATIQFTRMYQEEQQTFTTPRTTRRDQ